MGYLEMATEKKQTKTKKVSKKTSQKQPTETLTTPRTKPLVSSKKTRDFPIVGIGASAGGLEAIEGFFSAVPSDAKIAFVIVQHLAPEQKSMMGSLLEKYTLLKIAEIQDGMKIEPGCIYLNPPNKDVSIIDNFFSLIKPVKFQGIRLPIDYFFRSLAQYRADKAICIILSGTGSDGTLGLKAVKEVGGMAMAQEESQARYDGMPRSAINTGLVDYVLPVEKMPHELMKYIKHPYIDNPSKESLTAENIENHLHKIFVLIRSSTGHDFSHYKRNTIFRRIQRRMAVHQIENIADYIHYLQENPAEVKKLFNDLLITVTNFFRDPKAFNSLSEKVILPIVEERATGTCIRVWVAGCATGEEAYSIAILFSEAMQAVKKNLDIKIFATDIDAVAVEHARCGVYPKSIASEVSPERLSQFFIKKANAYAIKKQVREMVIFANQNIIKDAPFSRLDLICCRNVLIYMDTVLQKKLLPLFHYTLRSGGFLFLGTSETIGSYSDRFSPIDFKWKIFKRKGNGDRMSEKLTSPIYDASASSNLHTTEHAATNIRQIAEKTILQDYSPPCVLIDEKFDILYFHGETGRYLKLPQGEPSYNILDMASEDLHYKLRSMLYKVSNEKKKLTVKGLKIRQDNGIITINLSLRPLLGSPSRQRLMMVTFEQVLDEAQNKSKKKGSLEKTIDPRIPVLEHELQSAREYLQATIEELETSNEEFKSTNEELQSTNEEMQSSNEELETSREELQNKVDELFCANDDLNNILAGARVGAIFLDSSLRIKRFTPSIKQFFNFIESDIGRPIVDIAHTLKYERLYDDIVSVLETHGCVEKEIETEDRAWVFMRIIPSRTSENIIEGVVLTFIDATERMNALIETKAAKNLAEATIETVREPLVVLNEELYIVSANKSFYDKFKLSSKDTENRLIYEIGDRSWDVPELRELLEDILPKKNLLENFKVEHEFMNIGHKVMLLNARQIFQHGTGTKNILLAIEDVTEK